MKKTKLLFFILLNIAIFTTTFSTAFAGTMLNYDGITVEYNAEPIILEINGKVLDQSTLPMQPIIINGTTLVPVREVFEALGAVVDYKSATKEIFIGYGSNLITMTIDKNTYTVNGEEKTFTIPPKIINDKTMIPLRAVSEGMGLTVDWDNATRKISITENNTVAPPVVKATDKSPSNISAVSTPTTALTSILPETSAITINFSSPVTNVSKALLDDNRLIIDAVNSTNNLNGNITIPNNSYYTQVRTSLFASAPTPVSRVVIQLNSDVYYSVLLSTDRKTLKIYFGDKNTTFPTVLNPSGNNNNSGNNGNNGNTGTTIPNNNGDFFYDTDSHSILISKSTGITKNSIIINDTDAFRKNIIVNLGGNYSNVVGNQTITVNDGYIQSYTPLLYNNKTTLNVKLSTWGTLTVTENQNYVKISFVNPKELYSKIVVIDAGHGGTDVGAVGFGMYEKDLNFKVAMKFGSIISSETDIKVYYTRTDDTLLTLKDIGQFASTMGDLLFSVHTNSFDKSTAHGVETLYLEHANDSTVGISSEECAKIVQKNLAEDTGLYNRGIRRSQLVIFKNSTIPSVLGEMGFISNPTEAALLSSDEYLNKVARSYADSTKEIFSIYTPIR